MLLSNVVLLKISNLVIIFCIPKIPYDIQIHGKLRPQTDLWASQKSTIIFSTLKIYQNNFSKVQTDAHKKGNPFAQILA